ncbi:hypothetical protein AB1Y20_004241 [Prymnesium parvum]|uniref:Uncharacterized protein n=1 Tax=Prymnesium parvum TaxID=97485 RepID=A0AB34J8U2_PRYPA
MLVVCLCYLNVVLPGCAAQSLGLKLTADAAQLKNAQKGKRTCTNVALQLLCHGVTTGNWTQSVKYMCSKPQSCCRAFLMRCWFGKDNAANMTAHVAPSMEEATVLEKDGLHLDVPMTRAPWSYKRADRIGHQRGAAELQKRELATLPGTEANKNRGHVREVLVLAVRLLPIFMFAFDGATTLALAGVSLQSKHADPFTNEHTDDMGSFHNIYLLKRGRSLTDVAEELSPGCTTDPRSPHRWLLKYLCSINANSRNVELQTATREPERDKMESQMGETVGAAARKAKKLLNDTRQSDGRTDTRPPYRNADIRRLNYKHDDFTPGIDGDALNAATQKRTTDCLIRVPVRTRLLERNLPNAAWRNEKGCTSLSFIGLFGLCIIHCAMRTCENCLKQMLLTASTRYLAGKGKDRDVINKQLNDALWTELRVRRLISLNDKGQLNKVTLNGEEVRVMIDDLLCGHSMLLQIISNTYSHLGDGDDCTHMHMWTDVLFHWATAMRAGYKLRATPADREIFREHTQWYVMKKAQIRSGTTVWYDWQLYSAFPSMFDKFGSLMLISQEGMEACQKRANMLMRLGNGFANAGRIPWGVLRAGKDSVKAYLANRKRQQKTPEQWLWWKNLVGFASTYHAVLERVEDHRRAGRTLDWTGQFVPEWESCRAISTIHRKLLARARFNLAAYHPSMADETPHIVPREFPTRRIFWTRSELPVRPELDLVGQTFSVVVYDAHRERLIEEVAAYCAPVRCQQESSFPLRSPEVQRKEIQRQRRERWRKRERSSLWVAHI